MPDIYFFLYYFEISSKFRIFINVGIKPPYSYMYYNTTFVRNPQLREFQKSAIKQEQVVLEMMKVYNEQVTKWSTWDLHDAYPSPIEKTSVGRALYNLAQEGKVIKLDEQKPSKYGRPEHLYTINKTN